MTDRDTIFALSSGPPPSAIAVVRVSGPQAKTALEALARRVPPPRTASLARLRHKGEALDDALVLWLPGPKSETGEDMAELHLHGGRAVIAAVLAALGDLPGLRPAAAGEFTRRAFENGRLDLTAVEGLADLIHAETEAQRRLAHRQMAGAFAERIEGWRTRLVEAIALIEAGIDFSDERDVSSDLAAVARGRVGELDADLAGALSAGERGERLREGLVVAIAGPPNAGKSSLINRLARRDVAIVTPYAGTTRDVIEVHLDLNGYPVTVFDTAGIRDSDDPVELEGIRRARERAAAADLVLWVVGLDAADALAFEAMPRSAWVVGNKRDLVDSDSERLLAERFGSGRMFFVSAGTGSGLEGLVAALAAFAADFFSGAATALMSRERHRRALLACRDALQRGLSVGLIAEELFAEELRLAARELGRVTGRVDPEHVLDVIFRDFCIGK